MQIAEVTKSVPQGQRKLLKKTESQHVVTKHSPQVWPWPWGLVSRTVSSLELCLPRDRPYTQEATWQDACADYRGQGCRGQERAPPPPGCTCPHTGEGSGPELGLYSK